MSHKPNPDREHEDLEREIRAGRAFSLSEAIGRMAGGGMMKGGSPVTRQRQAEIAIEDYLLHHLNEAGGVLGRVLLRQVRASERLLADYDRPLVALSSGI